MSRISSFDDFDEINSIMTDILNEGMVERYYISKKLDPDSIGIKSVTITSQMGFDYKISFGNIKVDYREYRLRNLLTNNKIIKRI